MKQKPLVSVIVITYNQKKYIKKALDSILEQKVNFTFEIIVGDDCSTDGTNDIIKIYEKNNRDKMVCIYREHNLGAEKNFNDIIFNIAQGKYIAECEGDDFWETKDKLQKQIDFLRQNPEYIGIASNVNIVGKYGNLLKNTGKFDYQNSHVFTISDALKGKELGQSAGIVYKNFFCEMSLAERKSFCKCKMNGDIKISVIAAARGKIFYSEDITANYRYISHGANNWNSMIHNKNMNGFYYDAFISLKNYVFQYYQLNMQIKNKLLNYAYNSLIRAMAKPSIENIRIFMHILKDNTFSNYFLIHYFIMRLIKDKVKKKNGQF